MSQYRLIFTNVGLSKKQNAELNNDYIQITKFAVGSGVITNLLPTMTGLIKEEYRADINNVDTKNGTTIFDLIIPSNIGGFWIKEVALFDIDGDCICIGTVPITYKVNQDEGSSKAVHIKVSTTSTNTENIVFNTDDSLVYATVSYVNSRLEEKENVIQDGGLNIKKLDIDGATDIGADLVDADLIVVDDGANGTNRKSAVSRIWTYISGKLTGAISSVTTSNLTASRTLVSDAQGKIKVSVITVEELEYLKGAKSSLQVQIDNKVPKGLIVMWSGAITTVPEGWALCNGANGTPDLRNRFIVGASVDVGSNSNTNITGTNTKSGGSKDSIVVSHTHTQAAHNHTASTSSSGAHAHAASTGSSGAHTHGVTAAFKNESLGLTAGGFGANNVSLSTTSAGAHTHTVSVDSAGAHTHTVSVNSVTPLIDSAGSSGENANLPPYYALAFIMKL